MIFAIGDYLAGMLVGLVTALSVRMVVWPGMDMVIAMENVYLDIIKAIEGIKDPFLSR